MADSKDIKYGADARAAIVEGVRELSNAVRVTLGPCGLCVAIEKSFGGTQVTKDGVSVAKQVVLCDPAKNIGVELVKQIASKQNDRVGDGTTTTVVMANSGIDLALGRIGYSGGSNDISVPRVICCLRKAADYAVQFLSDISEPVNGTRVIEVATVASNGDHVIGREVAEAIDKIGKDGVITVEGYHGVGIETKIVEGMQFDRGYISPYFVTANGDRMEAVYENALILLTDSKISNINSILTILETVAKSGRPLLIIADDVDGEALTTLVVNKLRGGLSVVAVKAPGFGDRKVDVLNDIAVVTGGTLISSTAGYTLANTTLDMLGSAKRIIVTKDNTTIIDGAGTKYDIDARCTQIRGQINGSSSEYDKEKLRERLAKLSGGIAVIKVGGATEVYAKERKDRVEDATSSTRAAVKSGIVPGGGAALLAAAKSIKEKWSEIIGVHHCKAETDAFGKCDSIEARLALDIIMHMLEAPMKQIIENAGCNGIVVMEHLKSSNNNGIGFNACTLDQHCDMKKAGIINATQVEQNAIKHAVEIVTVIMSIGATITDKPSKKQRNSGDSGGAGYRGNDAMDDYGM